MAKAMQAVLLLLLFIQLAMGQTDVPEAPRIESVAMSARQPQAADAATIWYDDFDGPPKAYAESSGNLDDKCAFGGAGKSMLCLYEKGKQGRGNRKVFFGDAPAYRNKAVRVGEKFEDVYWRIYVKHQKGWTGGGPAKLSRATSIVSETWAQAMIAHVWSSGEALTLDPASGVVGGQVVTTKYNDFDKLHWLGNKPVSKFKFSSAEESGWWVVVEARAKLNTPGRADGEFQLWIDGRLESERKKLNWRGSYAAHGINAVFLEAYWNAGSPVTQSRWYDNFVISTKPIGPVTAPRNPVLLKTPFVGPGAQAAWEVELAADPDGAAVVWRSSGLGDETRVRVEPAHGAFAGPLAGKTALAPGATYWCRARQQGSTFPWSPWSGWHQAFVTEQ